MARIKTEGISLYKRRTVQGIETLLSIDNFRVVKNDKLLPVKTISIFGNDKPTDAVLVVADNFRAAAEAAVFMYNQRRKFNLYPCVIIAPGFCTPKRISYNEEFSAPCICMDIMEKLGVPSEILNFITPDYSEGIIKGIEDTLEKYPKLKTIAVFSSRGFSSLVAQELLCQLPKVDWRFYENPVVQEENRVFDAEIIGPEGLEIDLLIGNLAHSHQKWYEKRLPLFAPSRIQFSEKEIIKKILLRGYVAGMVSCDDWAFYGVDFHQAIELAGIRFEDVFSILAESNIEQQIKRIVIQYESEVGL